MRPCIFILLMVFSIIPRVQSAEIIASDRRINWDPGIPGGIPYRTTTYVTLNGIDATGATDVRAAIQTALDNCPTDQVVQLPAGTFRINGGISMPSRATLRGMGPATVLDSRGSAAGLFTFGNSGVQWDPTAITTNITAGATAGSTSLTVASAAGISVGTLLVITELNDPSFVTIDATTNPAATWVDGWNTNGTRARGQIVQVTSVSGSTIGISPGLYSAYSRTPWATHFEPQCQWSGVEDIKTSSNNTGTNRNFLFQSAAYCWVKNVESDYTDGDHMTLDWSYRCEIRHNYLHDSYIHASGSFDNMIGLRSKSSACLVIDNIIRRLHISVMCEWGAAGNVIAYNYTEGEFDEGAASGNRWLPGGLNLNHGAHPQFNLFEGNITSKIAADSYWGSSSHTTIFRNDVLGTGVASPPFTGRGAEDVGGAVSLIQGNRAVDIWEAQTQYNIVGNLVGIPALLSRGVVRRVVSPAARSYDNPPYCFSYGYTFEADGGGTALQNPVITLLEHGNWDVASSVINWDATITNHDIPASLFLTTKPAWFGNLAWPPIDPANASNRSIERIPAGYRYVHGYDPQSVADTTPPSVPAGLTATAVSATQINLSWTASTDNIAVAGYRIFRSGTQIGTATGTTYSSTGLTPATAYSFTVAAYDTASPANVSAQSTAAAATTQANHAPVAQSQSVSLSLNTAQAITLVASDADGDALTYAIVAGPAHGTLSGSGASRTYTPTTGYAGSDSFTFTATDARSAVSNTATVTLAISATENLWGNQSGTTVSDDRSAYDLGTIFSPTVAGQVQGIRFYVATGESGAHTARLWNTAGNSLIGGPYTITVGTPGWYVYNLATPVAVSAGVTYTVVVSTGTDANHAYVVGATALTSAGSNAAHLRYPANAGVFTTTLGTLPTQTFASSNYLRDVLFAPGVANHAPVATAQAVTTAEDTAKAITLAATDADGNALTYSIVANPAHGTLSGTGAVRTYTPAANYNGADSFTFKANDGTVDSNTATVSITVTAVNDAPVAIAQAVTTPVATAKAITLAATDVDGDALTYAIVTAPAHGTLSGTGAARTYTPAAGYIGADSFTFTANDGTATSAAATVSITVNSGTLSWAVAASSVADTAATCTLTVRRTNSSAGAVSVAWATSAAGATAVAGADYDAAAGTLNWAAGDTTSKTVSIRLHNLVHPTTVAFPVVLSNPGGGAVLGAATTYVTLLESSLPAIAAPWTAQDVGTVWATGSASIAGGTITLAGSGADIWGGADGCQYLAQPLTGDGQIEVRVLSQTNTNGWAKAGLMFRETLAPTSPHASLFVTPTSGVAFGFRSVAAAASGSIAGPRVTAPEWLRLKRVGNVFSAYASPDGVAWTLVGTQTVVMGSTISAGLAVCSHANGRLSVATFSGFQLLPTASN